jgi:DNA-binding NtrC family response regulator
MQPNILIVEDDSNTSEAIELNLEMSESKGKIKVYSVRTIKEAENWLNNTNNVTGLKVCILDLMFPPKTGSVTGDPIKDLTQGIALYNNYLKNRVKTIILTGALTWARSAETAIKDIIKDDQNTILIKKPVPSAESLIETIISRLE